jgi:hypothetical protein
LDIRNTTHLRTQPPTTKRFAIYQFPVERKITLELSVAKTPDHNKVVWDKYS